MYKSYQCLVCARQDADTFRASFLCPCRCLIGAGMGCQKSSGSRQGCRAAPGQTEIHLPDTQDHALTPPPHPHPNLPPHSPDPGGLFAVICS